MGKRYVCRPGHPMANERGIVCVDDLDVEPEDRKYVGRKGDFYMDGQHAIDGTDIGSMKKRREYMSRKGFADYDDFKGARAAKEKERAQMYTPGAGYDRKQRREDIGRSIYELEKKGRR